MIFANFTAGLLSHRERKRAPGKLGEIVVSKNPGEDHRAVVDSPVSTVPLLQSRRAEQVVFSGSRGHESEALFERLMVISSREAYGGN